MIVAKLKKMAEKRYLCSKSIKYIIHKRYERG